MKCVWSGAQIVRQVSYLGWILGLDTGSVGAEYTVLGTSWSALTLEAGKLPTVTPRRAQLPVALWSSISAYASPPSCSWSLNYALLETGADTVCRSKESAREPLMVPALLPQAVRSIC